MLPKGFGAIIRTVADGKTDEMLQQDLDELIKTWQGIEKSVKAEKAPALIYKDMNTTSSVIRDLFQDTVEHVVVDEKKLFKEIRAYVQWVSPDMLNRVEYYREKEPIFDKYGIEKEIVPRKNGSHDRDRCEQRTLCGEERTRTEFAPHES
jgi:ribonuclease G